MSAAGSVVPAAEPSPRLATMNDTLHTEILIAGVGTVSYTHLTLPTKA